MRELIEELVDMLEFHVDSTYSDTDEQEVELITKARKFLEDLPPN